MRLNDLITTPTENPMKRDIELLNYFDDSDLSEPILFFYTWLKPAITIGKIQKNKNKILEEAYRLGLNCYTRPTGGRAVLHGWDICYTFIAPQNHSVFGGPLKLSFSATNQFITNLVNKVLKTSINQASFNSPNPNLDCFSEIVSGEGIIHNGNKLSKIIGSAQAFARRSFIQQGSIQINNPKINSEYFLNDNNLSVITGSNFNLASLLETLSTELQKSK